MLSANLRATPDLPRPFFSSAFFLFFPIDSVTLACGFAKRRDGRKVAKRVRERAPRNSGPNPNPRRSPSEWQDAMPASNPNAAKNSSRGF